MDWDLARRLGIKSEPVTKTIQAKSLNEKKLFTITHVSAQIQVSIGQHHELMQFHLFTSTSHSLVLGYPWLLGHNPHIAAIPKGRLYSISGPQRKAMNEYITASLEAGLIRPSSLPAGVRFFIVGKKDGSLRPCINYSPLNDITIKNRYPLPLKTSVFDQLQQAKIFTKLDLHNAYHLIRIREVDEWKTGFNTPSGHYEYCVMPFGLTNAPAVFQAMIDDVFKRLFGPICVCILSQYPDLFS